MKFRLLAGLLIAISFCFLTSCTGSFSSPSNGFLFVATQGNSSVDSFAMDLTTGALTDINQPVNVQNLPQTGVPLAMVLNSAGDTLFGVNTDGSVWSLPVNSDGTMGKPTFAGQNVGSEPEDIVVDSSGKFLFVASQGNPTDVSSGTITAFSISGSGLTQIGNPVSVALPGATINPGPSALAITSDSKFLYVANTFDNSLAAFSVDSNGNLTSLNAPTGAPQSIEISPSGLTISPDGSFLYVAAFGTDEIFGFAICDTSVNTCTDVNNPDGSLTKITAGFPASAGLGPTRMVTDPSGPFLFAVGTQSNQALGYKISIGSGALTSSGNVSVGTTPTDLVFRKGTTINADSSTQEYLFVANSGAATVSSFTYESTTGALQLSTTTATQGQPVALAIK
jgi:6-phosphogluconolactonase